MMPVIKNVVPFCKNPYGERRSPLGANLLGETLQNLVRGSVIYEIYPET
jgi:hypothetical protein